MSAEHPDQRMDILAAFQEEPPPQEMWDRLVSLWQRAEVADHEHGSLTRHLERVRTLALRIADHYIARGKLDVKWRSLIEALALYHDLWKKMPFDEFDKDQQDLLDRINAEPDDHSLKAYLYMKDHYPELAQAIACHELGYTKRQACYYFPELMEFLRIHVLADSLAARGELNGRGIVRTVGEYILDLHDRYPEHFAEDQVEITRLHIRWLAQQVRSLLIDGLNLYNSAALEVYAEEHGLVHE